MDNERPTVPGLCSKPSEEYGPRDPDDRPVSNQEKEIREKILDKTLADSFPTSDPLSTVPDPEEDSFAA